jgi:transposase
MLQLTPQMKLRLAVEPADFRKGIDALVALCQQYLKQDPFSGCTFVFRNRTKNAIKLLTYDGTGFWLCLKRFSQGQLKWWPTSSGTLQSITPTALQVLLSQGDPSGARLAQDWRSITPPMD